MNYPDPNHPIAEFTTTIARDFAGLFLGPLLGKGAARYVFLHALNPDQVIKIEMGARSFQNQMEWETWQVVKDTPLAVWFAPCLAISPCGTALVMARTFQPKHYPDKLPSFFTDHKLTNYGQLGGEKHGHFVCHDYGLLVKRAGLYNRMRKVDWWHLEPS